MDKTTPLFHPLPLGVYHLSNRIIMAPLTRGRAQPDGTPSRLMVDYYQARATAGLIITEATAISPQGYGWINAPGIWSDAQAEAWQPITRAVHAQGGHIFLQLWHMGRVSHPDFLNGQDPVAPSAIAARGEIRTPMGKKAYVIPHALSLAEIEHIVTDYAAAAKRAVQAGFDGVEIHCANGYLVDQFIRDGSNQRTDRYGGTLKNRLRFLLEVITAVTNAIGAGKVGVRLSPKGQYNDMQDGNPIETFTTAASLLAPFHLSYLHTTEALPGHLLAAEGERVTPHIRKVYPGPLITNGGYNQTLANQAIAAGEADAIAFGTPFIANADLVWRFQKNAPLNDTLDFETFYTGGARGYTDYPVLFPEPRY